LGSLRQALPALRMRIRGKPCASSQSHNRQSRRPPRRLSDQSRISAAPAVGPYAADAILVEEAPVHRPAIQLHLPMRRYGSFHTMASGDWVIPCRFRRHGPAQPGRRIVCLIGDGLMMYSLQALLDGRRSTTGRDGVASTMAAMARWKSFSHMLQMRDAPGFDLRPRFCLHG